MGIKKSLLIAAGFISLFLGIIGIFLPLVPTTPFLLLSAACFLRSSDKYYNWLINHKIFGKYIQNYVQHKAIPRKTKILTITLIFLTLGFTIYIIDVLWLKILLALIGTGVIVHLLRMKTLEF